MSLPSKAKGTSRDRGVALLFVLITVLLISVSTLSLVRAVTSERARSRADNDALIAASIERAMQAPIEEFLVGASAAWVLPPASTTPSQQVLDDVFTLPNKRGARVEVRLTAFDQFGMLPLSVLKTMGPMLATLPEEVLQDRDFIAARLESPLGLDRFVDLEGRHKSPFPKAFDAPSLDLDQEAGNARTAAASSSGASQIALGAYLATGNKAPGELNVNTTPIALLAAVYRVAGVTGIDPLISARQKGERYFAIPGALQIVDPKGKLPKLVTESTCIAFRIDVLCGSVRRSWWAVYEAASAGVWVCAQRVLIP